MMNAIAKVVDAQLGSVPTSITPQPRTHPDRKMKCLVWKGKKSVEVVERPVPVVTDPGDVIVKVTATTICGSDLHLYTGSMPDLHEGDILGHEFMGVVEEVGENVKNFKKGQRVVASFDIACGACSYCKREEYTCCDTTNPSKLQEEMYGHRTAALYGYTHLTGGIPGGQAEYVRVPWADVNLLAIPDDVPDDQALYLSDIVPTALHGVELGHVKEGSTVAVWGLGPVGLLACRWAQIKKAAKIIGIDNTPARLARAQQMGCDTINFKEQNVIKTLFEKVPGGVDTVIECAGFEYAKTMIHKVEIAVGLATDTADILSEMFTCVRKSGFVSIIGVYSGFANHFPIGQMMEKGLNVAGGQSPTQKYWKYCLEKIQSGEIDPRSLVTHRGKLSDAAEMYKKFYNHDEGIIKIFLTPN